jgi:hypothetical protein
MSQIMLFKWLERYTTALDHLKTCKKIDKLTIYSQPIY